MSNIKLFESQEIRSHWDAEKEKWYFSIVDIVGVLTDSPNPRKYWSVLKGRLNQEGSQLTTNCSQLKRSRKRAEPSPGTPVKRSRQKPVSRSSAAKTQSN